ncbi:MAG: BNR-4 repeat-containing protein [Candidatus Hydrogenedentes bacterium]|nr:BNR-4 repeat-containing protein [Candidatus Hydrogenedentota bacterium]
MMTRRTFLKTASVIGAGPVLSALAQGGDDQNVTLLSETGCGRATGYAEANKIVSIGENTHVAWLDSPEEGFRVRMRTLDRRSGEWSPVYTIGEAHDNHGGPALTVDSEGYLHISYFPHHHPMRYRRSVRPNDASEWTEYEEVGKTTTYPTLVCGPDDTLYLTCRESSKTEPWVANLYTRKKNGPWEGPRAILQAEHMGYAHFMDGLAWSPDFKTLHLTCRIYDNNPGRGHTIGYLRSEDFGETWTQSDGTPVELPANAKTVEVINQNLQDEEAGLRGGGVAVLTDGRPCLVCSDYRADIPSAWIAVLGTDGAWEHRMLRPSLPTGYEEWGLITPGNVTRTEDGRILVALIAVAPPHGPDKKLWGHGSCEIAVFDCDAEGNVVNSRIVTSPDASAARWLPSIERPTGHNRVPTAPGLIFTEGPPGGANTELLSNKVYWVNLGA